MNVADGAGPKPAQAVGTPWARRLAGWLNTLAGLLTVWTLLAPWGRTAATIACAAAPLVAVAVAAGSGGAIGLDSSKTDPRPHVAYLLAMPLLALMARAVFDVTLLSMVSTVAPTVAGAAIGAAATFVIYPAARGKAWPLIGAATLGAIWTFSVFMLADVWLDRFPPQTYEAAVVGKTRSHARATSFRLKLAPWGPRPREQAVSVEWDLYRSVSVGDRICVDLHRGAFGARWFQIARCNVRSFPVSDHAITPRATAAISRVQTALISGETPRRTWL
jgi:hypothetical protein